MPIVNVTDISKDFVAEAIARMEKDIQTVAMAHRGLSNGHEKVVREWQVLDAKNAELHYRIACLEIKLDAFQQVFEKLRDCHWEISLPDQMNAVREIARKALEWKEAQP